MSNRPFKGEVLKLQSNGTLKNIVSYGFPNKLSKELAERMGWKCVGNIPILGRSLSPLFRVFDIRIKNKKYKIKKIEGFDKNINEFTSSIKNKFRYFVKRDKNFLNWRYSQSPKHYEKRIVMKGKKITGYVVFRCGLFNNIKTGIILDILSNNRQEFNLLLDEIVGYFSKSGMKFASCYMINNNFYYKALLRRGFMPIPSFLLPKKPYIS